MSSSLSGRVHNIAGGTIFMSIFGTIWLVLAALFSGRANALVLIPLAAGAILITGAGRRLRRMTAPDGASADSARVWRSFMVINIAQYAAMAVAIIGANLAGRQDLIPLLISVVVALHFLPLARLFQRPVYWGTASAILLFDAYALVHAPHDTAARAAMATGSVLWATAVVQLVQGFGMLRGSRPKTA